MKGEVLLIQVDEWACLKSVSFDSVLRKKLNQNEAIIFTFSTLVQAKQKENEWKQLVILKTHLGWKT